MSWMNEQLTKDERKAVEKKNRELLKEARRRGINPTDAEKAEMLKTLMLQAIAEKQNAPNPR